LLDYQNNYIEISSMMINAIKSFDILQPILQNYFDVIIFEQDYFRILAHKFKYFSRTIPPLPLSLPPPLSLSLCAEE